MSGVTEKGRATEMRLHVWTISHAYKGCVLPLPKECGDNIITHIISSSHDRLLVIYLGRTRQSHPRNLKHKGISSLKATQIVPLI